MANHSKVIALLLFTSLAAFAVGSFISPLAGFVTAFLLMGAWYLVGNIWIRPREPEPGPTGLDDSASDQPHQAS